MTLEDKLSSRLEEDRKWRIIELSEIVRACNDAVGAARQNALLRASLPIMYAHWEGYFVFAANIYLNFVAEKRIKISLLRDEFWILSLQHKMNYKQINSDAALSSFVLKIKSEPDRTFKRGNFERINGKSNLNSQVLKNCCEAIGISFSSYSCFENFLDQELIDKRNHIAHGSAIKFEKNLLSDFRDNVIDMMRITHNELENSAITQMYKK